MCIEYKIRVDNRVEAENRHHTYKILHASTRTPFGLKMWNSCIFVDNVLEAVGHIVAVLLNTKYL
jgi:hypothetical protein